MWERPADGRGGWGSHFRREIAVVIKMTSVAVVAVVLLLHQTANAEDCACREICATADFGAVQATGEWDDMFSSGRGFGGSIGISLAQRLSVGFEGTFHDCDPNEGFLPAVYAQDGFGWALYTTSIFAEYQLSESRLAPFVGGQFGVHFTHTDYRVIETCRVSSLGDHGLGYGASAGLRYRLSGHWGLIVRARAESTPGLASGWRPSLHAGISLFM